VKIRLLWFGNIRRSPFEEEIAEYRKRIGRRWLTEDFPLRPERGGRDYDPARALQREADQLRSKSPLGAFLIALDEGGHSLSSPALAEKLGKWESESRPNLVFLIGSDLGLDRRLVAEADYCLSLSPMTFPHMLARLLLWEQLYRATDILRNGQYHRGRV